MTMALAIETAMSSTCSVGETPYKHVPGVKVKVKVSNLSYGSPNEVADVSLIMLNPLSVVLHCKKKQEGEE